MKKSLILALSLTVVASAGYATGTASGAGPSAYLGASIIANTGSITGTVYCGEEMAMEGMGSGARPWSTVWVQGHSFSARTDEDGVFVIDYVPPGTYTLGVQTAGMPIRNPKFSGVVVRPRAITDVGDLVVTGGCGQCGGGGGHDTGGGGCEGEEGGGCEGGGSEGGGGTGGSGGCEEGGGCSG